MGQHTDMVSLITAEVSIYEVASGGYVVTLAELLPEEALEEDRSEREAAHREMYGHSWPRNTVSYARAFPTLAAIRQSGLDGFAVGAAGRALDEALRHLAPA